MQVRIHVIFRKITDLLSEKEKEASACLNEIKEDDIESIDKNKIVRIIMDDEDVGYEDLFSRPYKYFIIITKDKSNDGFSEYKYTYNYWCRR
jgi:hypothetical protein